MYNILDYLNFRGDISLRVSPLNEVDVLILSQITFMNLSGIADVPQYRAPTLREATERFFAASPQPSFGLLMAEELPDLLRRIADSRRFGNLRVFHYDALTDTKTETQFAALCVSLGFGSTLVTYCGTDDTIIGWKENFNMSFMDTVPAQRHAAEYLSFVASRSFGKLYIGGHSKGGNLAVYAAMYADPRVQKRIAHVWNNDGPGFPRAVTDTEYYRAVADRITTTVPHFSIVGLLLEHGKVDKVVQSNGIGIWQHNPCTWAVNSKAFVAESRGLSKESAQLETAVKAMIAELSPAERREFVDALYAITVGLHAETMTDLSAHKLDLLKAVSRTDGKTRKLLLTVIKLFFTEHYKAAHPSKKAEDKA